VPENSAVSVEPGIYLPDELGVRIEDLVIVTDFGAVNIVRSAKELIVL
jgi:Xaa-Pro aminopeptidase